MDEVIKVRLDKSLKNKLIKQAKKMGLTLSAYVRVKLIEIVK